MAAGTISSPKQAQLIGIISRAYQENWREAVGIINIIEEYLENKYSTGIKEIDCSNVYKDPKSGEARIFEKINLPKNSTDFQTIEFLKKARLLFRNIHQLNKIITSLPAGTASLIQNINTPAAQANFLIRETQEQLQNFKHQKQTETAAAIILKNFSIIQQSANALMETIYTTQASAE